jgi:hypothetical protein
LKDELLALRVREMSNGQLTFDHRRGRHDDRATALALATLPLLERGDQKATSFVRSQWTGVADTDPQHAWRDAAKEHNASEAHRRWSMRNVCLACRDEWQAQLRQEAANG